MEIYAAQGFRRFVLCLGYKGELIEAFVGSYGLPDGTEIVCAATGIDTPTGGRSKRVADHLLGGTFSLAYADTDVARLGAHHEEPGAFATITLVRPQLTLRVMEIDASGRIRGFHQKPQSEHWINAGFLLLRARCVRLSR